MRSSLNKLLKPDLLGIVLVSLVIFALFPAVFGIFRLSLIGKYLTYAFVAVSLVLLWGTEACSASARASSLVSVAIAWRCT